MTRYQHNMWCFRTRWEVTLLWVSAGFSNAFVYVLFMCLQNTRIIFDTTLTWHEFCHIVMFWMCIYHHYSHGLLTLECGLLLWVFVNRIAFLWCSMCSAGVVSRFAMLSIHVSSCKQLIYTWPEGISNLIPLQRRTSSQMLKSFHSWKSFIW